MAASVWGRERGFGARALPPREEAEEAVEVRNGIAAAVEALAVAKHACVFTGAGLSTAAGIEDLSGNRGHVNRAYERKRAPRPRKKAGDYFFNED